MLWNLERGYGFILLHIHQVVAVLDQADDPVDRPEKKKYSQGYEYPFEEPQHEDSIEW